MAPGLGYKFYTPAAVAFDYPDAPPPGPLAARSDLGPERGTRLEIGDIGESPPGAAAEPLAAALGTNAVTGGAKDAPQVSAATPDLAAYEYTMTLVCELRRDDDVPTDGGEQVVALVDDEVRGVATPKYVAGLERWLLFIVVAGNGDPGEQVTFRINRTGDAAEMEAIESVPFVIDGSVGSVRQPLVLNLRRATDREPQIPTAFSIGQNYPNPFGAARGETRIRYALPSAQHVVLKVYDLAGRVVATPVDERQPAGRYEVVVHPNGLASGVYFYRFEAGPFTRQRRMVILQ
jgi:hypothetical protein